MSVDSSDRRPFSQRLDVRLALAFAIALLPLAIVSALQSQSLLDEAQARSEAALLGETLLSAAPEAGLIRGARVSSGALAAAMTSLYDDQKKCSTALERVIAQADGAYSYAVFVPLSGMAVCTSNQKPLDLTASKRVGWMLENQKPDATVIRAGVASGTSVLAFGHPVFDIEGEYIGYVSISMPHSVLESQSPPGFALRRSNNVDPIALITFDNDGTVLTASNGMDKATEVLPSDRALVDVASDHAGTFTAVTNNGRERVFATFPLIEGQIYAIGSWPTVVVAGPMSLWISPFLMPALMWAASLLVAVMAAERLVTRHIRALRKSIIAFAAGNHRMGDIDMPDAAIEITDVANAYLKMTDTIMRDEAELEDMVHQREVLLREVHHRVKNNLQLIASIINMQMRKAFSPETKLQMKGLQDRVMSLATIHRGLYQTSGLTDVRADELLSDILRQILQMSTGPERRFDVVTHFDELHLTPDQAVPLSLLLTEALTNAVKYAGTSGPGIPRLEATLRRQGATEAVLIVENSIGAVPPDIEDSTGLGSQLMTAFAQQLGADSQITALDGRYRLQVRFTIRALTEAEAGKAPDPDVGI